MEESDIQDILKRSGIRNEAEESRRKLDKFENLITDIALRLIDEEDDMDAASAGMDILDAINANIMTESLRRNAGTWYDPLKRALDILEDELPEDILGKVRDKLDAYSKDHLRDKSEDDEEDEDECDSKDTTIDEMVEALLFTDLDRVGRKSMNNVIDLLQMLDGTAGMRFTEWSDDEAEMRKRAGLTEECQCQMMDDHGMDSSSADTLAQVIPELRGIALHYVQDKASQQRLQEIAKQLTALKTQLGSSI